MNLKQAVKLVIKQNQSDDIKYPPTRFIIMTKNGEIKNLDSIISKLVLKGELTEILEQAIKKHGKVLTIEDLIIIKDDNFGFPHNVVEQAKARSDWFNQLRNTNDEWITSFT